MLHPASQQSPFVVDVHEQVGSTCPHPHPLGSGEPVEQSWQGPGFSLLSSLLREP